MGAVRRFEGSNLKFIKFCRPCLHLDIKFPVFLNSNGLIWCGLLTRTMPVCAPCYRLYKLLLVLAEDIASCIARSDVSSFLGQVLQAV